MKAGEIIDEMKEGWVSFMGQGIEMEMEGTEGKLDVWRAYAQ